MKLDGLSITLNASFLSAMQAIDKNGRGFVCVVNSRGQLKGLLTDGDIRRRLIAGAKRESSIVEAYNESPLVLSQPYSYTDVVHLFKAKKIRSVPVVDKDQKLVGVLFESDYLVHTVKRDNPVVIMAGGRGQRLMPLTKDCPKPLVPVAGKPMIERIIENLRDCGFHRLYLTVNYKKETLKDYFGDGRDFDVDISYVEEPKRLGTAGSLNLIRDEIQSDVIVTNGDILCGVNFAHILDQHIKADTMATMAVRNYSTQIPFGVVQVHDKNIKSIMEKPSYSYQVSAGINVLSPGAVAGIPEGVFYDMPTVFNDLLAAEKVTQVYHINEYWFDLGTAADLDRATEFLQSHETMSS